MLHGLIIAAMAGVVLWDQARPPWEPLLRPWPAGAVVLGTLAVLWLAAHVWIVRQGRLMDQRGSVRSVRRADLVLSLSRLGATLVHLGAVFGLGWVGVVRGAVGDTVLLDEFLASLPLLVFFLAGWWSIYPVDRRIRDAMLLRRLDEGLSVHPTPSRAGFVISAARHQMALVVVPLVLIMAWGEGAEQVFNWMRWPERGPGWMGAEAWKTLGDLALPAAQFAGVFGVFALAPVLLRHIWDTVRLGPGELRASILELCGAARVRVRDLLVWRTGGTMINGAVIGLLPPARYILLTDALLEMLTPGQIRAVAAHEIAHVRRRHIAWLAAAVLASVFGFALLAEWGLRWALGHPGGAWTQAAGTVLSLGAGFAVFGWASRRFEWQADAFAAAHLSGHRDGPGGVATVTPESIAEMTAALQAVADLNHVPVKKFTWRHGSIAERQRRLERMVWQRTDRLTADRSAGWVKALAGAGMIAVVAGFAATVATDIARP